MCFKNGERGTAQCEKLASIEGGRGTVVSTKSGAGGKISSLYAACEGFFKSDISSSGFIDNPV